VEGQSLPQKDKKTTKRKSERAVKGKPSMPEQKCVKYGAIGMERQIFFMLQMPS